MSELRQLKQRTTGLLKGLGSTADEVAESLGRSGVEGVPKSNRSCAVARYVTAVMGGEPGVRSVAVGPCSLVVNLVRPEDARPAGRLLVQLPKPVRQFVSAFDAGQFPDLERRPTDGVEADVATRRHFAPLPSVPAAR
jgi:hypothetical protein